MILWGFLASMGAGLMTGIGALPVLVFVLVLVEVDFHNIDNEGVSNI